MNGINIHTQRGKSYYCNSIELFINDEADSILGKLVRFSFESNNDQRDAWINQIKHLQVKLSDSQYKTLLDLTVDKDTELQWIALAAIDKAYESVMGSSDHNSSFEIDGPEAEA